MRKLILLLIVLSPSVFFSQEKKLVINSEINYFDGLNWVESVILDIKDDTFFVYTNRAKTKTAWVSKSNVEPLYGDTELISDFEIQSIVTYTLPVYHQGDTVYYGQKLAAIQVLDKGKAIISFDSLATNILTVNEEEIVLYSSVFEMQYREVDKTKTYSFKLGDSVKYIENGAVKIGKIDKINKEKQLFINEKWHSYKNVEKAN